MSNRQVDPILFPASKQVILAGLDERLNEELSNYLRSRGLSVRSCARLEADAAFSYEDCALAFCDIRHANLRAMLRALRVPVVVVSRLPEVEDWLDAMDAGAADYCAAPIEPKQLDWILESNLRKGLAATAAA